MAFSFSTNLTPATFAEAIFNLKTRLKAAGWTVPASSDGTTYNAAGDEITTGASGAGGMDNPSAWFRIQMPDGLHEFTFQRTTTAPALNASRSWRVKYSIAAHFTGGSPAAAVTPSAADEHILIGGGTDAAPTFVQWMSSTDATYSQNIGADGTAPYGFFQFFVITGSACTTLGGNIVLEPMTATVPGDPDPYVIYWTLSADTANSDFAFTGYANGTYMNDEGSQVHCAGYIGATWSTSIPVYLYAGWNSGGNGMHYQGVFGMAGSYYQLRDPINAKDLLFPLLFGRGTYLPAPQGYKGLSTNMRVFVSQIVARNQLTLESVVSPGDYVSVGPSGQPTVAPLVLPWNNSAVNG